MNQIDKVQQARLLRLEKLRSRWRRWVGQKLRSDRPFWTDLLDANLKGWPNWVLDRSPEPHEGTRAFWRAAINVADYTQLAKLDTANLDYKTR